MYEYRAHVRSAYDGDTIRVDIDLGFGIWTANQQVRLLGIDAPEMTTSAGKPARDFLRGLLPVGQEIVIRTQKDDSDKYGRWLATIFRTGLDGWGELNVNQHMIDTGHARPYDGGTR